MTLAIFVNLTQPESPVFGDITLAADPMLMHQALSSLGAHPLRHTARLQDRAEGAGSRGRRDILSVSGYGCDIAKEHFVLNFDRFYRGDTRSSAADSTSLRSSAVRLLAELQGSAVTVISKRITDQFYPALGERPCAGLILNYS